MNSPCPAVLALAAAVPVARAESKMPAPFGDHMVLQQDINLPVSGPAALGETTTVQIKGHTAAADGKWIVRLDPLPVTRKEGLPAAPFQTK